MVYYQYKNKENEKPPCVICNSQNYIMEGMRMEGKFQLCDNIRCRDEYWKNMEKYQAQ